MAQQMFGFLTLRLTNVIVETGSTSTQMDSYSTKGSRQSTQGVGQAVVRHVNAAFVDVPHDDDDDDDDDEAGKNTDAQDDIGKPQPWAIEIEVQPPDPSVTDPFHSLATNKRKPDPQHAHLLFLSSSRRLSSTHYPLLLWKAPPAHAFSDAAQSQAQQQQQQQEQRQSHAKGADIDLAAAAQPSMTARLLIAHALDFISRYFDCRMSQQAPLCSIRGANLESMAEAIVRHHRIAARTGTGMALDVDHFGVDLGFALPTQLPSDLQLDLRSGPAPDLNLISLTVPAAVVKELMRGAGLGK